MYHNHWLNQQTFYDKGTFILLQAEIYDVIDNDDITHRHEPNIVLHRHEPNIVLLKYLSFISDGIQDKNNINLIKWGIVFSKQQKTILNSQNFLRILSHKFTVN